jgi:putative ABC transport system permease protein
VVSLHETRDTARVVATLGAALEGEDMREGEGETAGFEVLGWEALNPFYRQTVQLYQQQFGFLVLVILFMVALSVGNTINANTHERAAEFGTMAACGAPQREIYRLILLESALLGLGGGLLGALLGNALALLISDIGIPMPPPPNSDLGYISLIRAAWWISGLAFLVGLLAPVLAALRPASRAAKGDVAEALRQAA